MKTLRDTFREADALAEIERKRDAHLLELEQIEADETEKILLRKRINDFYDNEAKILSDANIETKKVADQKLIDEATALERQKRQLMYDTLDTAADVAGRESDIGKALLAIKMVMQIQELAMKMKGALIKMGIIKVEAAQETAIAGAKVGVNIVEGTSKSASLGFPWNIIAIAGMALQGASMLKSFGKAKSKVDSLTGMSSGSIGGGASAPSTIAAPSFNVLGNTSSDANMIANTVAGVNDNPMRAYVVDNDITSRQSLTRNAMGLASVG